MRALDLEMERKGQICELFWRASLVAQMVKNPPANAGDTREESSISARHVVGEGPGAIP